MIYRYAKYDNQGFFCGVTTSKNPLLNKGRFTFVRTDLSDSELLDTILVDGLVVERRQEPKKEVFTPDTLAILAREKRDALLLKCDWTQVPDAPVDRVAWASYRQELRDITSQEGFPTDVIWPIPPK